MSLELNADNLTGLSFSHEQAENQTKTFEKNDIKEQNQINNSLFTNQEINSNFDLQNENKEKEAKSTYEIRDSYDDDMYKFLNK